MLHLKTLNNRVLRSLLVSQRYSSGMMEREYPLYMCIVDGTIAGHRAFNATRDLMGEKDRLTMIFCPPDVATGEKTKIDDIQKDVSDHFELDEDAEDDVFLKPYHDTYGALCADMGDRADYVGISENVKEEILKTVKELQPDFLVVSHSDPGRLQR